MAFLTEKNMSLENTKAAAVMEFVQGIVGAFESGFIDTPICTIGQIYQVARNHVKDEYGIETKTLAEEMGEDFASECNPKPDSPKPEWIDIPPFLRRDG
jgi:hypothetical protein